MNLKQLTKYQIATSIAIFFHGVGLVGVLFFNKTFFINATIFNLLLSFLLLIWTHEEKNKWFILFVAASIITGIGVEIIGVNTGALFGSYTYGKVLGLQIKGVPYVIGLNWFIVIYSCGICIHTVLRKAISSIAAIEDTTPKSLRLISVIVDGASLAVLLDWIMEPVTVKLGYWQWESGLIPIYNYVCWFLISTMLLIIFHFCKFKKQNKFAIHLLMIQVMFFLLLRTFL